VKTDFKLEQTQLVAVSDAYICYGLRAGHIRALERTTGGRALFKGHPAGISCMCFFSPSNNLLASVSKQGDIAVRRVTEAAPTDGSEATIDGQIIMAAQLPAAALQAATGGPFAPVTLAWHPTVPQILAAGAGSSVHIFEVPNAVEYTADPPLSQPGITYSLPGSSSHAATTCVTFTPSGDLLLAGDSAGGLHAWWLEGEDASEAPLISLRPFGGNSAGIGSVRILHQAADGASLLLTGDASNSTLQLWALPAASAVTAGTRQAQELQTVSFKSKPGSKSVFCHVEVQPDLQLVVLADAGRQQVYTLHYRLSGSSDSGSTDAAATDFYGAAFDYAAFFSVKQPILSLSAIPEAAEDVFEQQLLLYCVQPDAIQQYMLDISMCTAVPGAASEESVGESAEPVGDSLTAGDVSVQDTSSAAAAPPAPEPAGVPSGADYPTPAQLPTPTLLGSRSGLKPSPAKAAEPSTPGTAAAGSQQQQQQQSPGAGSTGESAVDTDSSRAAPLPPMPTFNLMHSAEKAPSGSLGTTASELQESTAAPKVELDAASVPDAASPAAAADAGKVVASPLAAAAPAAAAAAVPAPAPAATAVSSGEVAALQQQMVQLLQLQQQMAAQLQASTQQTVAGVRNELGRGLKSTEASLVKQVRAVLVPGTLYCHARQSFQAQAEASACVMVHVKISSP
jgi:hypothetical protein